MDGTRIYHANTSHRKARVGILNSDRVDFKARKVIREKSSCVNQET